MSGFDRGFANFLYRFALSIDIVDRDTLGRVRRLVGRYLDAQLPSVYFEVGRTAEFEDNELIKTIWCSESDREDREMQPIRRDGEYASQTTQAYGLGYPLWVVAPDKGRLVDTDSYVDLWSGRDDLRPYQEPKPNLEARTSIVVPLKHTRPMGVMYLECKDYLESTEVAREELDQLARAIAILLIDFDAHEQTSKATNDAMNDLERLLETSQFPQVTRPRVFIASSNDADPEVIGTIKRVVADKFGNRVESVFWKEINETGLIDQQLVDKLMSSKFGICYLSEPRGEDESGRPVYHDNPNVLFEAGMLHALGTSNGAAWIPVREESAERLPFNLDHLRVLEVPREGGRLNREMFTVDLERRMEKLGHVIDEAEGGG